MASRRDVLGGAAAIGGIAFVGCSLMGAAPAPAQTRRRETVVGGRRVKTVDVHCHCTFPDAMALMGVKPNPPELYLSSLPERIKVMDAQGIDVEALSINPFWYKADRDRAKQIISIQNEGLAKICAAEPERFVAFASVALQYPDLAVEQLVEGVKKYALRSWRRRNSIRSGPSARNSGSWSSFIRRAPPSCADDWPATAGSTTSSAIRSRPPSRSRT
jgi:hypothetical protein